ncbi:MAG: hypothetical protein MJ245_03005 [Clostridia bacterium]|nr:hypothetical protein [Clostridia bacterium]
MKDIWFYILTFISITLLFISFFCPPTGIIDGSVLTATVEIFAFAALGTVLKAINKGVDAELTKGDTNIKIKND